LVEPEAPRFWKRRRVLWIAGGLALLVVLYGAYSALAASTFSDATAAHRRFDCTSAINHYNTLLGFYKLAATAHESAARRRRAECRAILAAEEEAQAGRHSNSAAAYRRILVTYPNSLVERVLRDRRAEELIRTGDGLVAAALDHGGSLRLATERYQTVVVEGLGVTAEHAARDRISRLLPRAHVARQICRRAELVDSLALEPEFVVAEAKRVQASARKEAPALVYSCAESQFRARRYQQSLSYFRQVVREWGTTKPGRLAKSRLIDAEVALIRGGRTNKLPAPTASGTTAYGEADLRIRNSSPYALELLLSGHTPRRFIVPSCASCEKYEGSAPTVCPPGIERTFVVTPGAYSAVVRSPGKNVTPWSGDWALKSGYKYSHCFYIVVRKL
jgi:hypothetical protein